MSKSNFGKENPIKLKFDFIKNYILPVLFVFLIPLLGYCFFGFAKDFTDQKITKDILRSIDENASSLSLEEQKGLKAFYTKTTPKTICKNISTFPQELVKDYKEVCGEFKTFDIIKVVSFYSFIFGFLSIIFIAILAALSSRSQELQYTTFLIGFHFARIFAFVQIIIQSAILVGLSCYITALWNGKIYFQLVGIFALSGLLIIFHLFSLLFQKIDDETRLDPRTIHLVNEVEGAKIVEKIREICSNLGTEVPQNILLGVDDAFYVTEQNISLGEIKLSGRTLYLSLFQLKHLSSKEAEAVFVHEMAHFSGQDTLFSKKMGPILHKSLLYMDVIYQNLFTRPIWFFMNFFINLFYFSIQKIKRERELRADKIASEQVGEKHLISGLVRLVSYSNFRKKVLDELFLSNKVLNNLNLIQSIRNNFHAENINDSSLGLLEEVVHHPFDSHPSLKERIEALNSSLEPKDVKQILVDIPHENWYQSIEEAEAIENKLMSSFEEELKQAHEKELAYRYLPLNNEEKQIVEKYFPTVNLNAGKYLLTFDYEKVSFGQWTNCVYYKNIASLTIFKGSYGGGHLSIFHKKDINPRELKIPFLQGFHSKEKEIICETMNLYFSRSVYSIKHAEKQVVTVENNSKEVN